MEEFSHLDKHFTALFWKLSKPNTETRESAIVEFISFYSTVDSEKRPIYFKYGLNRLVKGLKSMRHQARLGFSNALVQLVLDFAQDLPTSTIMEAFRKHIYSDKPECKAELTGQRLAFVFCAMILVQCKRVPELSAADLETILNPLLDLLTKKSFVPAVLVAIGDVAIATSKDVFEAKIAPMLEIITPSYLHGTMDSDRILFCLKVNRVHGKSLKTMKIVLPKDFLSSDRSENFFTALTTGHETTAFLIAEFFLSSSKTSEKFFSAVKETLESTTSPVKNKGLCLKLALHLLSRPSCLSPTSLPALFSSPMCAFLQRQLSNRQFVLHQHCATSMHKLTAGYLKRLGAGSPYTPMNPPLTAPGSTNKNNTAAIASAELAMTLFTTIVEFNPLFDLNNCAPQKLLSGLLAVLPADLSTYKLLIGYARQLQAAYRAAVPAGETGEEDEGEARRNFVAGQLKLLVTCGKMEAKDDIPSVLKFMLEMALFKPKKDHRASISNQLAMQASFYKCLDSLATQQQHRRGSHDNNSYLTILQHLLSHACTLLSVPSRKSTLLFQSLSEAEMSELGRQLDRTVADLRGLGGEGGGGLAGVLALLRSHLCLQALADWASLEGVMEDVDKCQQKAATLHSTPASKRRSFGVGKPGKVTETAAEWEEPHWSEVLTDCLVSLLSQSSHLLRSSVGLVFSLVVPYLTPRCAQLIREVLVTRVPVGGAEEDDLVGFEEDDDDEEELENEAADNQSISDSTGSIENGSMDIDDNDDEKSDDEPDHDNSSSSDDDSDIDDIGVDEDNVTGPEMDQLRQRVGRALSAPGVAEGEEEEGPVATDAEMFKLDAALIAAFRAGRKGQTKRREKERRRQLVQVKMRCLDLYEVILTHCKNIDVLLPALVTLVELVSSFEDELKVRVASLMALLKKRSSSGQQLLTSFSLSKEEKTRLAASLTALFDMAKKAPPSNTFLAVFSGILHFLFKSVNQELVTHCIKENIKDFFENRSSHLNRAVFTSLFEKCPQLVWTLRHPLLTYAQDVSIRPYCRTQAFTLILQMGRKTGAIPEAVPAEVQSLATAVFQRALTGVPWQLEFAQHPSLTQAGLEALCWAVQTHRSLVQDLPEEFITAVNKAYPQLNQDAKRAVKKCASIISQMKRSGSSKSKRNKQKRSDVAETMETELQNEELTSVEEPQRKRVKVAS